jgi:tRNA threonylcarbamoyladenosine biosynthesis protein TsaB
MDARRNQVYTGLYEFIDNEFKTIEKQCAVDISDIVEKINNICSMSNKKVVFLGDGVDIYRQRIEEIIEVGCSFAPACANRQRAACVATLGIELYKKGIFENAADHAPEYLRLSQAEREREEKK